jgi:NAD(P)-dependent dehydrogenase (short-subunit alcohol dehydrogenase family)
MKNYVIIGGSTGIGNSLAHNLSEQGYKVIATFNNTEAASNSDIQFVNYDMLSENKDFSFLPDKIDGIAYCVGSINLKPFHRIKVDDFVEDYKLQVSGAIEILQKALPALKAAENPSVVLFSTVAVQQGYNFHSMVSSSKGAIEGLTRALAAEWAPTVRVNCIAPSLTNTPMASRLLSSDEKIKANAERHPLKKIGEPSDIASMAAFLFSDSAKWITGQIMHVDGGMSSLKV